MLLAGLLGGFLTLSMASAGPAGGTDSQALQERIEGAASTRAHPFYLLVNCVDANGIRAAEVYRGQLGTWRSTRQFELPEVVRAGLLQTLANQRFADFAASYGGFDKPEKAEAPIRVACRIHLELDGLTKTSIQQVDGDQSQAFARLATDLLDALEPLGAIGTGVTDLEDALYGLADGRLAPEALELRFVELPVGRASGSADGSVGQILRIERAVLSRQAYLPGETLDEPVRRAFDACDAQGLYAALLAAAPWKLPINVRTTHQLDLELEMLGVKARVLGRPFDRSEANEAASSRLEELAVFLRGFCNESG